MIYQDPFQTEHSKEETDSAAALSSVLTCGLDGGTKLPLRHFLWKHGCDLTNVTLLLFAKETRLYFASLCNRTTKDTGSQKFSWINRVIWLQLKVFSFMFACRFCHHAKQITHCKTLSVLNDEVHYIWLKNDSFITGYWSGHHGAFMWVKILHKNIMLTT